ncbi:MAG TPA: hypothetical protein DDX51_01380 [Clostridiales bacterium]|nr:hypothetical protein [Clostridiales bacterium]
MYRLIALDLDGTVLTSDVDILPSTAEAVAYARSRGVKVIVCTGRIVGEAAVFAKEIGASSLLISAGGAAISDVRNARNVKEWAMPWDIGAQVVEAVQNRPVTVMIYVGDRLYLNPYSDEILSNTKRTEGFWASKVVLPDVAAAIREHKFPVSKVFARGETEVLAEALGEINLLPGIHITRSAENNFEVMPKGVNKGLALRELAHVMGISLDQIMAIGDSDNDTDMLKIVGMPVVMGNGDDAVKQLARYITDTNDNGGVAQAIYRFI